MTKLEGYIQPTEVEKLNEGDWAEVIPGIAPHQNIEYFKISFDPADPDLSIISVAGNSQIRVKFRLLEKSNSDS